MKAAARYHAITRKPRETRLNANARGYGAKWREARANVLKAYPLCCGCDPRDESRMAQIAAQEGITIVEAMQLHSSKLKHAARCNGFAVDVDHLRAVTDRHDPAFYDPMNLRPRSHECHAFKTVKHDGGFGH